MPRRILVFALALSAAIAVVGVAYAANVYNVSVGSTSPGGKGTAAKPVAKRVKFGYTVKDATAKRGEPVQAYKIAVEGITGKYDKYFEKCKFSDANGSSHATTCESANVGFGRIETLSGPGDDPNNNSFCNLELTIYNLGYGLALRLDADPPAPEAQDGPIGCSLPVHQAIEAKNRNTTVGGVKSSSLNFTVPESVRHPFGASVDFDNVVANTTATIKRKTTKVKIKSKGKRRSRTVGIDSAIGCKGGKRTVRVMFTDETAQTRKDTTETKKC